MSEQEKLHIQKPIIEPPSGGSVLQRAAVKPVDAVLQRQDADAGTATQSSPPGSTWTSDLITITLNSDQPNCLGVTTRGGSSPYGDCLADNTIRPPFCQSVRVPFEVNFYV